MDVLQRLHDIGAVSTGKHFVYRSGKHGPGYINPDVIFTDTLLLQWLCEQLAAPFLGNGVEVVVAAATGGIPLTTLVAPNFPHVRFGCAPGIWADKDGDGFVFSRAGFAKLLAGQRILAVEDLLTTGGSIAKVCRQVELHGGTLVGVSAICNRGGVTAADLGVPRLESLAAVDFTAEDAAACQLCVRQVPIVEDVGHGASYKLVHPDYPGGYIKLLA